MLKVKSHVNKKAFYSDFAIEICVYFPVYPGLWVIYFVIVHPFRSCELLTIHEHSKLIKFISSKDSGDEFIFSFKYI